MYIIDGKSDCQIENTVSLIALSCPMTFRRMPGHMESMGARKSPPKD